ncbi:hypothetical protein L1987_33928 [Smallanthus sonchifolius]|uniref:Uncharacterized protein n=1 Tax=Smallanthus sonchifolius TaxID=185202 RepID=A0ACB9HU58_9ASTR|nr:hypothetical protein L1987_33928 [Smallanthus sonchifolius]
MRDLMTCSEREEVDEEIYQERSALQVEEDDEEEDLNRIKEESRRRIQAILEKYKTKPLQQQQPKLVDEENVAESVGAANVKLDTDGQGEGSGTNPLGEGSMTKRIMLLEENRISFHSDDELIFDGVKDHSSQVAEMIGLGSDAEFWQAGVIGKMRALMAEDSISMHNNSFLLDVDPDIELSDINPLPLLWKRSDFHYLLQQTD